MRVPEAVLAVLGAAALILVAFLAPWLKFVLTVALAKGIAVLGILLLLRAGQVSFGHSMFLAVGAYTVAFIAPTMPEALLLLPLGALLAGLLGLVIGLFVVRYRDIFFGMLNLALSMVLYSLLEKLYALTKGTDGIRVSGLTFAGITPDRETQEWVMFGLALVLAIGFGLLVRAYLASPMGRALAGIKTRETRLEFMGVSARRGAALRLCHVGGNGRRRRHAGGDDDAACHAAARLLDVLRRVGLHRHPRRCRQRARVPSWAPRPSSWCGSMPRRRWPMPGR